MGWQVGFFATAAWTQVPFIHANFAAERRSTYTFCWRLLRKSDKPEKPQNIYTFSVIDTLFGES